MIRLGYLVPLFLLGATCLHALEKNVRKLGRCPNSQALLFNTLIMLDISGDHCSSQELLEIGGEIARSFDIGLEQAQLPGGETIEDASTMICREGENLCDFYSRNPNSLCMHSFTCPSSSCYCVAGSTIQCNRRRLKLPTSESKTEPDSRNLSTWGSYVYRGNGGCRICGGDNGDARMLASEALDLEKPLVTMEEIMSVIPDSDVDPTQGRKLWGNILSDLATQASYFLTQHLSTMFAPTGLEDHCIASLSTIQVAILDSSSVGGDPEFWDC